MDIAGVVHDYLYRTGELSRSDADKIWRLVALKGTHHANRLQAWVCWAGLRIFGIFAWKKRARERN